MATAIIPFDKLQRDATDAAYAAWWAAAAGDLNNKKKWSNLASATGATQVHSISSLCASLDSTRFDVSQGLDRYAALHAIPYDVTDARVDDKEQDEVVTVRPRRPTYATYEDGY